MARGPGTTPNVPPQRGPRRDRHDRGRRIAIAALAMTLLVLTVAPSIRHRAQAATSGLVAGATHWFTPRDAQLDHERRARLAAEARADEVADADSVVAQAARISSSFGAAGRTIVTARVIAFTPFSAGGGGRRVQLDAGNAAGIEADEAVVAPGGLVGRVTAVTARSATVTLLDDPASVVGARVTPSKVLGRVVGSPPQGVPARQGNDVSLALAQGGSVQVGQRVVTAGSPGGTPYPAGLTIGTIDAIDSDRGQLERSVSVKPAADLSSLDVVGVLTHQTGTGTS